MLNRLSATVYTAYHLRGQARYPFNSLASIMADRDRRVRRMVAYAYRYVPYYRETMDRLGLSPEEFGSAKDLARLPLLERAQVQRDPEYFVSTAEPLARHLRLHTSGSTGTPCTLYHHRRAMYQNRAFASRARSVFTPLLGRSMGYRQTTILPIGGAYSRTQDALRQRTLLPPGFIDRCSPSSTPQRQMPAESTNSSLMSFNAMARTWRRFSPMYERRESRFIGLERLSIPPIHCPNPSDR